MSSTALTSGASANSTAAAIALDSKASVVAVSMYYYFIYNQSFLTFIIPPAIAFVVYYSIYVPYFRRLGYRVRNKLLTER